MGVDRLLSQWNPEPGFEPLVDWTVGELLDQTIVEHGARDALVYHEPSAVMSLRWTYAELGVRVEGVAKGLLALGVQHGDKVAVLAGNVPEWVLLELAIARVGAVLVTVNTNSKAAELEHVLRHADVKVLFLAERYRDFNHAEALCGLVPGLSRDEPLGVPIADANFPMLRQAVLLSGPARKGFVRFEDVERLGAALDSAVLAARRAQVRPEDIFQIQFTSGTTGVPKGAMISHRSAVNNARIFARRAEVTSSDRLITAMPFFHTAGGIMELLGALANGATLVKAVAFDAEHLLELIHREGGTLFSAVATMVIAMLQHPRQLAGEFDTSHLRGLITGGTPVPVALMEQVHDKLGAVPIIGFGMTECSPMVTGTRMTDSFALKSSTVGQPLPHTEIKVADEQGRAVPHGVTGELCVRGYLLMGGYYKMPEQTSQAIDEAGWLHSGDLATMDEQGYLRIVGRLKDMVIRGGENVYPAEVENFLMRHPAISQAQVIGVPDAYMGEEIAAFVQLQNGADLDESTLRDYCKRQIARHKVPKYMRFVDSFPLTPSGKVKKFELRDRLVAELRVAAN